MWKLHFSHGGYLMVTGFWQHSGLLILARWWLNYAQPIPPLLHATYCSTSPQTTEAKKLFFTNKLYRRIVLRYRSSFSGFNAELNAKEAIKTTFHCWLDSSWLHLGQDPCANNNNVYEWNEIITVLWRFIITVFYLL